MQSTLDGNFKDLVQCFWIPHAVLASVSFLEVLAFFFLALFQQELPVLMLTMNNGFLSVPSEFLST